MDTTDARQPLRALSGGHPNDRRRVWYSIASLDLDPAAVTEFTGIEPDRSWRRGDPEPRTRTPYPDGAWLLESGLGPSDEFHDHLDALIGRLRPGWAAFVDLGRRHDANVDVVIECLEAQGPLVQLLPDMASALSELNATLAFDIYALAEHGGSDSAHVTFGVAG